MATTFQIVVTAGFLFIWYLIFIFMSGLHRASEESDVLPEIQALSNEVRLLRKLVDFENQELVQIKEKLKNHEGELEKYYHKKISVDHDRSWKEPIPVLVFACNRAMAVTNHVKKLLKYRPSQDRFPVIVTQDCDNDEVKKAVEAFGDQISYIKHLSGEKANITIPNNHKMYTAYYRIARHYKLALDHVFNKEGYGSVIITEDDLDIAPDFFEYFSATRYLLEDDPLLWCVSAWNDNGKMGNIDNSAYDKLYRSDFFPGLGWMMAGKTWKELGAIWPQGFWDDWMRDPARRKGRQCIRPEISRTGMTLEGKVGASKGQFFTKHLARIVVNRSPVKFTLTNLDYLLQANYDPMFEEEVFKKSPLMDIKAVGDYAADLKNKRTSIRVEYTGNVDYIEKADKLLIMHDFKAGVPRTAYKGVVSCFVNGVRVYLAPDRTKVKGYDPKWEVPAQFGE